MAARSSKADAVSVDTTAEETRLDSDTTKPATTAPGDAPADTTDPTERASTRVPNPGPEAQAAGTVQGVVPVEGPAVDDPKADRDDDEWEEYDSPGPDNQPVRVRHNLRTGRTEKV